ncbi:MULTISPECIES: DUF3558 domain-containing protein [Nocardia]|uniref:DUF3558 domain-containing protein n=1 Tax=Nocardia TaxID=1817 RepID=UPI000A0455CF|nr:DUF3558 domain-containing protein [Nocardia salmonicida]
MRSRKVACCVVLASALAACGESTVPDAQSQSGVGVPTQLATAQTAPPTLTDPKLQPPSQDNKYTQSTGRPKVVFDPCTWIGASDIESVGFESASRKRGPDVVAEYTFLTCTFRNPDNTMSLGLDSGNITWDENLKKNGSWLEPTVVNGRRAGFGKGEPGSENECHVQMETKVGVLLMWTGVLSSGLRQNLDPCANIMEIASAVEKSIGKEN